MLNLKTSFSRKFSVCIRAIELQVVRNGFVIQGFVDGKLRNNRSHHFTINNFWFIRCVNGLNKENFLNLSVTFYVYTYYLCIHRAISLGYYDYNQNPVVTVLQQAHELQYYTYPLKAEHSRFLAITSLKTILKYL